MKVVIEHEAFIWDAKNPRTLPIGFSDCSILARVSDAGETSWHLKLADNSLDWLQHADVIVKIDIGNYILLKGKSA